MELKEKGKRNMTLIFRVTDSSRRARRELSARG
jgi:hypothetical protein